MNKILGELEDLRKVIQDRLGSKYHVKITVEVSELEVPSSVKI